MSQAHNDQYGLARGMSDDLDDFLICCGNFRGPDELLAQSDELWFEKSTKANGRTYQNYIYQVKRKLIVIARGYSQ